MAIFIPTQNTGPLQVAVPEEGKTLTITREEIVLATDPRGQIAEQFRGLRNSIVALNPEGAPRTVVVTSALRGEGKSVAAVNLALALAEMPGTQVLLIDGNMHSPAVEDDLSMPRRQGLSELLSGRLPLDHAIRPTSVPNVAVLGAGSPPRNPSELLASARMKALLSSLKRRYSYVIIDTPEATTTSDASLLGAIADGVVLVVRQNTTPRQYVEQAYNMLESLGANVLGTLLTGAHLADTARGRR
ncbi:MAG TPA: CpsD/CapB family tyrosine-protein kinase [Planctomycetota bacterium]|nr:CpsD/CapB family tyrosine-protein kinase [Planctomycetota bacterium]